MYIGNTDGRAQDCLCAKILCITVHQLPAMRQCNNEIDHANFFQNKRFNINIILRMLIEHWIRAKYEWREFHAETTQVPVYLKGISYVFFSLITHNKVFIFTVSKLF